MTGLTAADAGPYQCFADNVRVDSSALWVVTVRDPGECCVPALILCLKLYVTSAMRDLP